MGIEELVEAGKSDNNIDSYVVEKGNDTSKKSFSDSLYSAISSKYDSLKRFGSVLGNKFSDALSSSYSILKEHKDDSMDYVNNMLKSSKARAKAGFTLIELMVVMGIIGVLAGIMFPAFSAFRESARRAKCKSNLRQIGMASKMYADDYNGKFPYSGPPDGSACLKILVDRYLKTEEILVCPGDKKDSGHPVQEMYGMKSYYFYNFVLTPEHILGNNSDSNLGAYWDFAGGCTDANAFYNINKDYQNHGTDGGNVVYVDGHVDWLPADDWENASVPKIK